MRTWDSAPCLEKKQNCQGPCLWATILRVWLWERGYVAKEGGGAPWAEIRKNSIYGVFSDIFRSLFIKVLLDRTE